MPANGRWDLIRRLRKMKHVDVAHLPHSPFRFVKPVTYFKIPYRIPSLKTKYTRTLSQNIRSPTDNQVIFLGND
jgi:hypothetical protein